MIHLSRRVIEQMLPLLPRTIQQNAVVRSRGLEVALTTIPANWQSPLVFPEFYHPNQSHCVVDDSIRALPSGFTFRAGVTTQNLLKYKFDLEQMIRSTILPLSNPFYRIWLFIIDRRINKQILYFYGDNHKL